MKLTFKDDSAWTNLFKLTLILVIFSILYRILNYIPKQETIDFFNQSLSNLKVVHFIIILLWFRIVNK